MPRVKKNGFVVFCQEKEATTPKFSGLSMSQLATNDEISDLWQALSLDERQKYVDRAKEFNQSEKEKGKTFSRPPSPDGDLTGRFDCYGRSMIAMQQKELMEKCRSIDLIGFLHVL